MATILRVKRKKEDEPLDALLLACKRQKVDEEETAADPLTTIVKFAGTVEKEEDCVVKHITKVLSKDALKQNYKQHIVGITKKIREKKKQESNENRYKIINSMRSLDTSKNEDLEEDVINIIDIEDTNAVPDDKNTIDYVYDLYYTQTKEALLLDNLVSVLPIEDELVFEDHFKDDEDQYQNESEDSNSESNWKNDYPDSDHSENSVDEHDIKNAMKNLNIEDELSTDDSDDFVYGLDEKDVERYGYKYAKYKARIKKEKENSDNCIDSNSDASEDESDNTDGSDKEYCVEDCDGED